MRKHLALVLALLMVPAAAAVVDENASNRTDDGRMGITTTSEAARSSQSFGGADGPRYDVTFTVTNTTGTLVDDHVEDISLRERAVAFTGFMQVPTPCHELHTRFEQSGADLVVTVEAESSGEVCVQQVVTKQYRMEIQGTEPFRVDVRHGGAESIRTLATTAYPPKTPERTPFRAVRDAVNALLNFLSGFF